jgi:putative glutamine amidotransferase
MTTVALLVGRERDRRYAADKAYADAIWAAGGTPVTLAPPTSAQHVAAYVRGVLACDAVCVTGGGDVDPARYGARTVVPLVGVDSYRDAAEIEAVRGASALGRPVLGLGRGIQVIAVASGGALLQDLPGAGHPGHWDEGHQHQPVHAVWTADGSLAEAALGGATQVNSIHHQAVLIPGADLVVSATSPDGVIEAIEGDGILGVQWHPERLWARDPRHLAPFTWLVRATRAAVPRTAPQAVAPRAATPQAATVARV